MPSDRDKKIRSLKDNPAGRVVSDSGGNRWEWGSSTDETTRLLRELQNDELTLERTGIARKAEEPDPNQPGSKPGAAAHKAQAKTPEKSAPEGVKPTQSRDAGGGFNPYDNTGGPRKR